MKLRSLIRVVLLFTALALLAGCALHRSRTAGPPAPLPEAFSESAMESTEAKAPGRWWEAFGDPQLDSTVEEVLAGNLDLALAVSRLEQAEALARSAAASRQPFLNLQGQVSRDRQPGTVMDTTGNNYTLSLAAGYELDMWRKLKSRSVAADLEAEATLEEVRSLYLGIAATAADLYYLGVEQRAQLELTDRTIASFADTLERVERRYREGLVPALDVYQARQSLAAARARRPVFENTLAGTEHALAVLAGHYPQRPEEETLPELPEAPEAFPAGLPSRLLANRPDIRAALRRVEASDTTVAAAIADRFPSFNLLGNFGVLRNEIGFGSIEGTFWNLILNLAQPVLDGGRRKAEVDRSRAAFREDLTAYHQAVLNAFREVEDALAANRTSELRIAQLRRQVEASEASLRLATDRYLHGLSDYLPVLTAQGLLLNAEGQLLAARRQLISDRIGLARALGGDWMEPELNRRLKAEN